MNFASIAERREVKPAPVPDTGAEPGEQLRGEGANGPSSTTETTEEEGSLMENARPLINTSEITSECTSGGPPFSTEKQEEEEEGASLPESVTAPSDSSKTTPQCTAGDSPKKSRKRVRLFVSAEEQWQLVTCCVLFCKAMSLGCVDTNPFGLHLDAAACVPRQSVDAFAYVKRCVCRQLMCRVVQLPLTVPLLH